MKKDIQQIQFTNNTYPLSFFEILRIEELLERSLDHDIYNNHIIQFYILFFVTEGSGYHTIDFIDYKYKKGTVLLIRKDQIHKFFRSPNVKGYMLIFTDEFIVSHLNELEALKTLQLFNELLSFPKIELNKEAATFDNFNNLIQNIASEYEFKDKYSIGITRSILHVVMTKLYRIKSQEGQHFSNNKYLEQFLMLQELVEKECFTNKKVSYYANKMACSSKTLNNIVQAIVSKPAKTFIDDIAIMQVKRLLISTTTPIKEIAYTVGFDDPTNFYKYFKKYVGSSPEVFRQAHN